MVSSTVYSIVNGAIGEALEHSDNSFIDVAKARSTHGANTMIEHRYSGASMGFIDRYWPGRQQAETTKL